MFDTSAGRIGIVICFDRHYAESFRSCVLKGADRILVPTANVIGEPLEMFDWEPRVAAFQNSVAIAMCNRVGRERAVEYCGGSVFVGADGAVVEKAGAEEGIFLADYDLGQIASLKAGNKYLELYDAGNFQLCSTLG